MPTLSDSAQRVMLDILAIGPEQTVGTSRRERVPVPGIDELATFCELIASIPREEDLQSFIERHPGFITGLFGTNDDADLAVLFKPPIGTRYRADFAILKASQGGTICHLIEIESSHERLYTRRGSPTRRLAGALLQLDDWRIAISSEPLHYAREMVRMAKALPIWGDGNDHPQGFRLVEGGRLEALWSAFGGYEAPTFEFSVVIGRWSSLSEAERRRLLTYNREGPNGLRTFEQLARQANARLDQQGF